MSNNIRSLQASVIQHACKANREDNLKQITTLIRQAAKEGSTLILLQELHSSLYFCQTQSYEHFDLAEPLDGPTRQTLSQLAKELQCVIVGSIFERRMAGVYHNTAIVLDTDGTLAGVYRKMHIPDDPGFNEKFYFTPGENNTACSSGFTPITTSIGKLGVLVCWDQWYPEAARLMALAGAEILLYPTAIGWDSEDTQEEQQRQQEAWTLIQRSHSVANHLPTLAANRVGYEPDPSEKTSGITFWGNSFISGPQGELLANGNSSDTQVISATLDLSRTEKLRQIWPYFRDRRIDAYSALTERSIPST